MSCKPLQDLCQLLILVPIYKRPPYFSLKGFHCIGQGRDTSPPVPTHLQEVESYGHKPCGDGYHANGTSEAEPTFSEPPLEPAESGRPRLALSDRSVLSACKLTPPPWASLHAAQHSCVVSFSSVYTADFYMQEAKRLKHKADALVRTHTRTHIHTQAHRHTHTPPGLGGGAFNRKQ